ncbi:MAG: type II secretion system protein [Myxococcota bacterium]|jgi:type II secretory pathway pseudopilin PulG|nr:type II secretion system protein [Myxococcota bacterium]
MLQRANKGYTLIELGVVISAIVVLIAFTVSYITPASKSATLEVTLNTVEKWAKVAQTTGNRLASFEACESEEPCKYKKWTSPENCPGSNAAEKHVYKDDGPCLYDLSNPQHRDLLSGLPQATSYTNKVSNKPFYLIHDTHQVQAFTCVPRDTVVGKAFTNAAVVADIYATNACKNTATENNALLYHTLSDLTAEAARILARRFNEEKTDPGDLPPIVRPPPKPLPPERGCSAIHVRHFMQNHAKKRAAMRHALRTEPPPP